eukprot:CAMPEP_0197576280 /NCGR_PEP_ID=MMETSP1326-20131121/1355_1 /TAXON_ID=1155430 /ORGANISM="Genus nov. species nov., Strain RCC2288" /LENGTH=246 /DNA_ID=CAMNT_0043139161 /DNA_START=187 /DNA_END=927 /DNA_ORIENTATION=+
MHPIKVEPHKYRGTGMPQYIRRLLKWRQMDMEYTFWQMYLLCTNPKTVYRHTMYRKQTKNQWARDDPAFVVVTSLLVLAVSVLYCMFYAHSVEQAVYVTVCAVLVDYLLVGVLLATAFWLLSNRFLRSGAGHSHAVEQRVEWLYAFDIHCNSFFPLFIMLYVVQLVLSPILLSPGFLPRLLSCMLYCVTLCYYHYCQFVGYNALPFLDNTVLFLYPVAAIVLATPVALLCGFNPSRFVLLGIYFHK